MTIARRFAVALAEVTDPALAGPELLPVRLTRACTRTLAVDGAGLSMAGAAEQRLPLGASSEEAELAERLQFTVGSGPCMTAEETGQPVFAVEDELRRRWPAYTEQLVGSTPFHAVVALPLRPGLAGAGAIDLYFRHSTRVPDLDVFDALAVGEMVTSALGDAAVWSVWAPGEGPEWLHGPTPQRRAAVWEVIGALGVELGLSAPTALALLRAHAHGAARTVDDVAAELLSGRLRTADLQPGR